jgi:hypothetical protein
MIYFSSPNERTAMKAALRLSVELNKPLMIPNFKAMPEVELPKVDVDGITILEGNTLVTSLDEKEYHFDAETHAEFIFLPTGDVFQVRNKNFGYEDGVIHLNSLQCDFIEYRIPIDVTSLKTITRSLAKVYD